jgi:NADH-quinone oxidoreductase subunit G
VTTPPQEDQQQKKDTATVTIDGVAVEARPGELLIKVAQDNGVFIPRFCWHERMKPVGMCRMCLVEVDGIRGLPPACTTTVTDGMVCHTDTQAVKHAQDDVLELLLINHPLDCPVCDRGGECPLQDQTLGFGPGESRFVEEKRHFAKPIPISEVVLLDRERCIQCGRCYRFADEVAGDALIAFVDRGARTQVLNHPEHPFASYFSGNTVQICPVGALLAKPYRFKARPWDLSTAETSCTTCAVQCRGAVQSTRNRLVRLLGVDSDAVNHGWLCDKGRYGFEYVHADDRVIEPQVDAEQTSWPEALDAAATAIQRAIELHGAGAVGVLGGARGTNEDAFAWALLAKHVIRTDNVDAQLGDGLPAEVVLGLPRASIADCDQAAAIVLVAPDLKETLPVLHLRLRRAAVELGVPIIDLSATRHGLSPHVAHALSLVPGEEGVRAEQLVAALNRDTTEGAIDDSVRAAADAIKARTGDIVVVLGRPNLAERPDAAMRAAAALAALPGVRFLSALRRSNVHGALECGLAPGILPGRVGLGDARWRDSWGYEEPTERGLDAEGMLRAAADGKLHVLVLLGADPLADFPDRALAQRALDTVGTIIAVDGFVNDSNRRASVFLPTTLWGEKAGTVTNLEGRIQRVAQKVSPEGAAMDDWRIAVELAARLGHDFDLEFVDEVTAHLCEVAPAFEGASVPLLRAARDGVRLPVLEHTDEIVLRRRGRVLVAADGLSWEPIKVAGGPIAGGASQSAVEASGTGATVPLEPGGEEVSDAEIAEGVAAVEAAADAAEHAGEAAAKLFTWDRTVADGRVPPRDAYALRLVTNHPLYDSGRTVVSTPSLAALRRTPELLVAAADLQRLGVTNGTEVKIAAGHGSIVLPVRAARGIAPGTAVVPFTADGNIAALIDASAPVTDLRVETLR